MKTSADPFDVNFHRLDLEKFIDHLKYKYELLSTINQLPLINDKINVETNPKKLSNLQELKWQYEQVLKYLPYFQSIGYRGSDEKKEYIYFTRTELNKISINPSALLEALKKYEGSVTNSLRMIDYRYNSSPLRFDDFYSDENTIQRDYEFEYLDEILDGNLIPNLDIKKYAQKFVDELVQMKIIIHIQECIIKKPQQNPLTQSLQWTGQANTLATIFLQLHKIKVLKGTKENIKRLLRNNFEINGEQLSPTYLTDVMDENKSKYDKEAIEYLQPFIDYLIKNRPKE